MICKIHLKLIAKLGPLPCSVCVNVTPWLSMRVFVLIMMDRDYYFLIKKTVTFCEILLNSVQAVPRQMLSNKE